MTGHTPAEKERLVLIMKKTYKIEVDCANCAQKMEDAANTVAGVEKATVSFMTQKMKVEFAEGADPHDTMENVLSVEKFATFQQFPPGFQHTLRKNRKRSVEKRFFTGKLCGKRG